MKLETTPETSKRMSRIKLKKNKCESILSKQLWNQGYRYRLNYKQLPGSPDIALMKYNIAIFVDGEFWHGKDFKNRKSILNRNKDYWIAKIEENMNRDKVNDIKLNEMGWISIHFWSKDVEKNCSYCIEVVEDFIRFQIDGK